MYGFYSRTRTFIRVGGYFVKEKEKSGERMKDENRRRDRDII